MVAFIEVNGAPVELMQKPLSPVLHAAGFGGIVESVLDGLTLGERDSELTQPKGQAR